MRMGFGYVDVEHRLVDPLVAHPRLQAQTNSHQSAQVGRGRVAHPVEPPMGKPARSTPTILRRPPEIVVADHERADLVFYHARRWICCQGPATTPCGGR